MIYGDGTFGNLLPCMDGECGPPEPPVISPPTVPTAPTTLLPVGGIDLTTAGVPVVAIPAAAGVLTPTPVPTPVSSAASAAAAPDLLPGVDNKTLLIAAAGIVAALVLLSD